MAGFRLTPHLYDKIKYFARFPQTGVSLKQMAMFGKLDDNHFFFISLSDSSYEIGQSPSQGTLFKASQFLHGKNHWTRPDLH